VPGRDPRAPGSTRRPARRQHEGIEIRAAVESLAGAPLRALSAGLAADDGVQVSAGAPSLPLFLSFYGRSGALVGRGGGFLMRRRAGGEGNRWRWGGKRAVGDGDVAGSVGAVVGRGLGRRGVVGSGE
jgi:hypothetical protein